MAIRQKSVRFLSQVPFEAVVLSMWTFCSAWRGSKSNLSGWSYWTSKNTVNFYFSAFSSKLLKKFTNGLVNTIENKKTLKYYLRRQSPNGLNKNLLATSLLEVQLIIRRLVLLCSKNKGCETNPWSCWVSVRRDRGQMTNSICPCSQLKPELDNNPHFVWVTVFFFPPRRTWWALAAK